MRSLLHWWQGKLYHGGQRGAGCDGLRPVILCLKQLVIGGHVHGSWGWVPVGDGVVPRPGLSPDFVQRNVDKLRAFHLDQEPRSISA